MIKTILVLSDGTEIFAGHNRINAIQSTAIEESCNNGEDLTFGSVCSSKISVNIITPQNQLPIRAGEKITLYEELSGQMRKKGVFNAEKPQRKTANTTNVTAYDNVSLLDKDVTEWFNSLADFPYSLFDMAKITCEHCGLKLKNSNLRNGDFLINEMKLESVTARQILQWVGEVCGYFCIADENGDIFFSWYVENSKTIGINRERDTLTFFKGTLTYEDYTVKKIDRVQIRQSEDDAGFSYPSDVTGGNVYIIQSNPFIIASAVIQDIENVALNLYNVLKDIVYTPCRVSISSSFNFNVGDIIKITDANGVEISTYITKKNRAGNKETLQSSGNFERNGATQLYSTSFSKNYGDKLILQKAIAKLNVTADDQGAKINALTEFQTQTEKNIAQINSEANAQGAKIEALTKRTTDAETLIAQIDADVDTNRARIDLLAEFQTETEKNIAEIETEANAQGAKINALTEFQTQTEKNIAQINSEANAQGAKIGLIVETNAAGENAVKGAILVEAINGQSTAKIAADRLDIEGKTLNIKVDAANITGALTIGQLPDTVAETGDIPTKTSQLTNDSDYATTGDIPTKTSQLTNDSGYAYTKDVPTETGITTIVKGVVTTDYVNALGITVNAANITGTLTASQINTQGLKITDGELGGWNITTHYVKSTNEAVGLYSGNDDGATLNTTDTSIIDGTKKSVRFFAGATNNTINTAPFRVLSDGSLYSTAGKFTNGLFDNCTINETCEIKGKLVGDTISSVRYGNTSGTIEFFTTTGGAYYNFEFDYDVFTAGVRLGMNGESEPSVYIYSEYSDLTVGESIVATAMQDITLSVSHGTGSLVGNWTGTLATSSDARKKRDVAEIPGGWEKIFDKLCARIYRYKDDEVGKLHFGFVAQELAAAIAETGQAPENFAVLRKGKDGYYSIVYDEFIALCVLEIQKLKARVCELERG